MVNKCTGAKEKPIGVRIYIIIMFRTIFDNMYAT